MSLVSDLWGEKKTSWGELPSLTSSSPAFYPPFLLIKMTTLIIAPASCDNLEFPRDVRISLSALRLSKLLANTQFSIDSGELALLAVCLGP